MLNIVLRAFVLLGFTILACAPLTAATQNADVKAAMQDVGKRDNPHGQGHLFDRAMDSNSVTIRTGDTRTFPPALTKNDRQGTATRIATHLGRVPNTQFSKKAKGTCARCKENFPVCMYNAIIYHDRRIKDEQLIKKKAFDICMVRNNECRAQCK